MKKNYFLAIFLLFFLNVNFCYSQQSAGITTISTITACPGTVNISLNIYNSPDVSDINLKIYYLASELSFVQADNLNPGLSVGGAMQTFTMFLNPPGIWQELFLTWHSSNNETLTTDGNGNSLLCDLKFNYYSGQVDLYFDNTSDAGADCFMTITKVFLNI